MGLQVFRVEDEVSSSKILEIACGELSIEVVQGRSSSSRRRREVLRPHLANVKQTVPNSIALFTSRLSMHCTSPQCSGK